jgi:DNA gyrase/topoisomerase IV subunit A
VAEGSEPMEGAEALERQPEVQIVVLTSDGKGFRTSFEGLTEPSTKNGRKFAAPSAGETVVDVRLGRPRTDLLASGTRFGRGALCRLEEVNFLSGAGKGVTVLKLAEADRLVGFRCFDPAGPVENALRLIRDEGGREILVHPKEVKITGRAGKGQALLKRGLLNVVVDPLTVLGPPEAPGVSSGSTAGEPTESLPLEEAAPAPEAMAEGAGYTGDDGDFDDDDGPSPAMSYDDDDQD